jgi:hypothetical protein
MFEYPNPTEILELRKGLKKKKLPDVVDEMCGDVPEIGCFSVQQINNEFEIQWRVYGNEQSEEMTTATFKDLSFLPEMASKRYELGMLIFTIIYAYGNEMLNAIPGPREAMQEANHYYGIAQKWEQWAIVETGWFL